LHLRLSGMINDPMTGYGASIYECGEIILKLGKLSVLVLSYTEHTASFINSTPIFPCVLQGDTNHFPGQDNRIHNRNDKHLHSY
jgi:hypothetical protein